MATKGNKTTFATLPPEVLVQIVIHIETAAVLSRLSQSCKRIRNFIEHDGFRVFVQTRFLYFQAPSPQSPLFWRDAARELWKLERDWDRKALTAWEISPTAEGHHVHRKQRQGYRTGQTMGFVPVIDSYEAWCGGDWSSRKEVLAWGAGARLVLRSVVMGDRARSNGIATPNETSTDSKGNQQRWVTYSERGAVEGRDDITSVNILPQQGLGVPEQVIVGRANGGLSLISLTTGIPHDQAKVLATYETAGRPVRSATINLSSKQVIAACLSDSCVTLYPLDTSHSRVISTGEVSAIPAEVSGKTWCCRFLNNNRLAVGLGPSKEPIRVYDIGYRQFNDESARSLAIVDTNAEGCLDTPNKYHSCTTSNATSVYSLASIPASSVAGGFDGDVFLSGAYDGLIRLHDLRTPRAVNAVFHDPVDTFTPIYSLLPMGPQRFIAGGGRHSVIKVFDLRIPGSNLYHVADGNPDITVRQDLTKQAEQLKRPQSNPYHNGAKYEPCGWNMYLNPSSQRTRRESPVYALSKPSQCSASFFAGIEGKVVQVDLGHRELFEPPAYHGFKPVIFPW